MLDFLVQQVRELVNNHLNEVCIPRGTNWEQLCSSMDAIEDTQLGIEAFPTSSEDFPNHDGTAYILVYGLLQCLYVQQDAVLHLSQAFGVPFTFPADLLEVRSLRNDAVGHPTRRDRIAGGPTHNGISRPTLSAEGFQLMTVKANGERTFKWVDLPQMISRQEAAVSAAVRQVIGVVTRQINEHRAAFRSEPLSSCFHSSLDYMLRQLQRCVNEEDRRPGANGALIHIEETLSAVSKALEKRGLGDSDHFSYLIENISHPVSVMKSFLEDPAPFDPRTVRILILYVQDQFRELRESCAGVDNEFATDIDQAA